MVENVGFRGQISAGKGLTHIILPDGGAIPIEKVMQALHFKAEVTSLAARDNPKMDAPMQMVAMGEAAPPPMERALDDYTINWTVDHIRSVALGLPVKDLPNVNLRALATDFKTLRDREMLGEFGHHPDQEQDWLLEVEALDGEFINLRMEFAVGSPNMTELRARIWKALHCAYAIKAGNALRKAASAVPVPRTAEQMERDERFQRCSRLLGERHASLSGLMHELGEMQFKSMHEDAQKLDAIVGNTQSILYSQRSLLTRVADRLRRIYEAS